MMTNKERMRMQRLESENRILREEMAKHIRIYGETLGNLVTAKATLEAVRAALEEKES